MTDHKALGLGLLREIEDAAGKCRQPVRLRGQLTERDPVTGEVIRTMDSSQEPGGCIEVPCGNRREQVCPPCSRLYKGDTFRVLIAGLRGGHGIPEDVSSHPAVFVTLIAPSFGLVHRGPGRDGQLVACRPRRDRPVCEHGQSASCGRTHHDGEAGQGRRQPGGEQRQLPCHVVGVGGEHQSAGAGQGGVVERPHLLRRLPG